MAKSRKEVAVHVPLQMGFGFEVCDSHGDTPPFLYDEGEVLSAIDEIQQALWVSTDTETTGLTDSSMPLELNKQAIKQGASNKVRMRTIQARIPTILGAYGPRKEFVFDTDKMSPALTKKVARAVLSRKLFIAHNAGFDLYWLRHSEGRTTMPEIVVDTMLVTRLLDPKLVLKRADMIREIPNKAEVAYATAPEQEAWKSLISGASGGSLADVVLAMYGTVVDKTYQKPDNWTGLLGFEHYTYADSDTLWADRILCKLLKVEEDTGNLYEAYMALRADNEPLRRLEPQVPDLVYLREKGMPLNIEVGRRYVKAKRRELAEMVSHLIRVEPSLEDFRIQLGDPNAGLDDKLKEALAAAFTSRGVILRKTEAKGAAQVGEKDLRACRAAQISDAQPLFDAWVAVCRAKKTSNMALEVMGFAIRSPDSRVRSLLSHGPVTGRLSAAEPNVQQFPRDQLFRAMCISPTWEGMEYITIVATVGNFAFLQYIADEPVTIGETVTIYTPWACANFWTDKVSVPCTEETQAILEKVKGKPVELGTYVKCAPSAYAAAAEAADEYAALGKQIDACFKTVIIASDFGALDVRVGAALCIRSQREMQALVFEGKAVPGGVQPPDHVIAILQKILPLMKQDDAIAKLQAASLQQMAERDKLVTRMDGLKKEMDEGRIARSAFFRQRNDMKNALLAASMGYRLAQCMALALIRGDTDYSALRDAFVADIDIHTFTGMKLVGRDPMKEFEGLAPSDRKSLEKKLKKELGPRRQQGKIANLSLLYGMGDAGFQEAAARNYDEHWTIQEAHDIRALWMDAYPEVELWHYWTECLKEGDVYLPDATKDKPSRSGWWVARTLGGRRIVATGLNAALSYQDQSSGADILGRIMDRLHRDYPEIFFCSINQVHDEQVFEIPVERFEEWLPIIETVMVEESNALTMPYGVPCAVSPASGPIWVKD